MEHRIFVGTVSSAAQVAVPFHEIIVEWESADIWKGVLLHFFQISQKPAQDVSSTVGVVRLLSLHPDLVVSQTK